MLSYEFFTQLPEDIFKSISSLTGANEIFLRQVCKYFSEVLAVESCYHWLDLFLEEAEIYPESQPEILKLAMEQGCTLYKFFYLGCFVSGNIPLIEYILPMIVTKKNIKPHIKHLHVAKWMINKGYEYEEDFYISNHKLTYDVAKEFYELDMISKKSLICSTLKDEYLSIEELYDIHKDIVFEKKDILKYASLKFVKFFHEKEGFEDIYHVVKSQSNSIEKLEYLLSKGYKLTLRKHLDTDNIPLLDWLHNKGYNLSKNLKFYGSTYAQMWRIDKYFPQEQLHTIYPNNIESLKWSLLRITPENFKIDLLCRIEVGCPIYSLDEDIIDTISEYVFINDIDIKVPFFHRRLRLRKLTLLIFSVDHQNL